jgi:competence protein CoiA
MQYALVDSVRYEAFKGGRARCPVCNADVIAKCGPRIIHHWAHAQNKNCDPWWENETAWHRNWKNLFPRECREVSHVAPNGEIHRADVKTSTGIVIEFQHSAIADGERYSRELFYENLVWVIDGSGFKKNFEILHSLPHPESDLAKDLVWIKGLSSKRGTATGIFWSRAENPEFDGKGEMVLAHGFHEIEDKINQLYRGHHQYDWVKPRKTWLDATCPVYIDFGEDECLVRLETYGDQNLPVAKLVSKTKFIHDANTQISAKQIARFLLPSTYAI